MRRMRSPTTIAALPRRRTATQTARLPTTRRPLSSTPAIATPTRTAPCSTTIKARRSGPSPITARLWPEIPAARTARTLRLRFSALAQATDFAHSDTPTSGGLYPGLARSATRMASLGEIVMKKAIAEFIGTFALVLVGCGAAVIGGMGSGATSIDVLGIAAAFGLTIVAMAYGIGQISGCHINPAVSFGVLVAGRMTTQDFITYVIAQVLGAIAGAVVLYVILSGKASGWRPGYLGEYGIGAALIYEVVATFLFLVCIFGVTQRGAPVGLAGLAIGLTLIAIQLFGINITGTSVNPARSLEPAIVGAGVKPERLAQVWLFIVAPLIGAGIAGYLFKSGILAADDAVPDRGGGGRTEVAPGASAPRKKG